jgi:hypothetical protein
MLEGSLPPLGSAPSPTAILTRLATFAILLYGLLGPGSSPGLRGQEATSDSIPARAGLQGELRLTSIAGETAMAAGASVTFRLAPAVAVGGGGAVVLPSVELSGDPLFPDRTLEFGYGGLLVETLLPDPVAGIRLRLRTLVGAGHAEVRDGASGVRLGTDNVVVLEPEVGVAVDLARATGLAAGLSWRFVGGLDDLDGVTGEDLGGPGLALRVRLGPF